MRIQFLLSEIFTGLRRNVTMTIAVVVSVALSLAIAGGGLLLREQSSALVGYWGNKVETSIFFCNQEEVKTDPQVCAAGPATPAQVGQLRQQLEADPLVKKVYYESQAEAYGHFKKQFRDSPLLDSLTRDQMQESLRVKLVEPKKFAQVVLKYGNYPGVQSIQDQHELLRNLFNLFDKAQMGAFAAMLLVLFIAVLLISNTVRISAYSRRRETAIMRLVGASRFSIQTPFILEAGLAGLLGAAAACGLLIAGQYFGIEHGLRQSVTMIQFIGWPAIWRTLPLLVLLGVAMTSVSAWITLRRHLKV